MKTTINIDEKLINEAMSLFGIKTKTRIIELGLQELIKSEKRKRLSESFGSQKDIKISIRRKF